MVECTPFLSQVACRLCFEEAIVRMMNRYAESVGGVVYNKGVCYVRYEAMIAFFPPLLQTIDLNRANYISRNCPAVAPINITGTAYHRNLKALLVSLTEKGPLPGCFSQSPDQVYGEFLCRGDVSDDVCWTCAGQASAKLLQLCPNSKKAIVWLDYCHLRYSDLNLEGVVDVNDKACQPDPENAPSPTSFDRTLRDLLSSLTSYATHENSSVPLFATGTSKHDETYGLVQCSGDISPEQCGRCLQIAASDIAECANGKQGARILRGSCHLAYGTQPFFLSRPMLVSIGQEKLKYNVEADDDVENTTEEADHDLPHISLWAIQDATNNFSEANKLGEGGFGPVYKVKLPDGQELAMKRLARASGQGVREFKNEVKLIVKLQHTILVRLIGCCLEKGEKLLVYEFMPNKSLDYFLKGVSFICIRILGSTVHRDLKAGNVLLDEQMNPKISDFGMARTFTGVHGQATTSTVVGT
ncbi:Cysteine-rich receptor-like protein kinase 25 [Nymphaea thermarum]|nr:Cysteine-rich receptor-like protein kinase 25 [Nymphaea thermarum]